MRSTTTREPEWTEEDLAEQLALISYRATLCDCCGLPLAMVGGHERDAPQLIVKRRYCWARKTLEETKAQWAKGRKPAPGDAALLWSVAVKG